MHSRRLSTVSTAVCLAAILSTSTAVTTIPEPAHAFDLKKIGKQINKNIKKTRENINRKLKKSNIDKALATGVATALIVGIASDSPAAGIITGIVIASAPELFKKDLYNSYGQEMAWSASLTSNKKRLVATPGYTVSDQQRKAVDEQVKQDVIDIQQALKQLGLYKMKIDGDFGPGSRAGVKEFQRSLGSKETGILTAEERHRLFLHAEQSGYVRVAALNVVDEANAVKVDVPVPSSQSVSTEPAIREYRLANSQFETLVDTYLKAGSLALLSTGKMAPNGMIELKVADASGIVRTVKGKPGSISAEPHSLTDQWARVYFIAEAGERIELNTRDDFANAKDAENWIEDINKRVDLIARLTGERKEEANTRIAQTEPSPDQQAVDTTEIASDTDKPDASQVAEDGSIKAGSDGRIVLASSDEAAPAASNTLSGFQNVTETCRQNIYVSFLFPENDDPISHYNITPPPGTIMMDNGDSTAYFTGSCVLGEYAFSYVHIDKGTDKDSWKHEKRDGKFMIDKNTEQCQINLNTPTGSAELVCFE